MFRFLLLLVLSVLITAGCDRGGDGTRLPTGVSIDPAGETTDVGPLPLTMLASPEGDAAVLLLSGYGMQGVQVVDAETGAIRQTLEQRAAFVGAAFSPDFATLAASGGNQDVVYRYDWSGGVATLRDSLVLAAKAPRARGTRYPAGIAYSPDGSRLYVAENLADSLAVLDTATGKVLERHPTGMYPYGVHVGEDGMVFVSAWGGFHLAILEPTPEGGLLERELLVVGRHPSTITACGGRLYVALASEDRIAVVDPAEPSVIGHIAVPAPSGPHEGSTPNSFACAPDASRLYVAEGDNNAVNVIDLASPDWPSLGRVAVGWYPTALLARGEGLLVANGKGRGTRPNKEDGPRFGRTRTNTGYTLGQLSGTLTRLEGRHLRERALARERSNRVAELNNWNRERVEGGYPPFEHVIYIIKENRTYDQVFGDMPGGDGDSSLVFFPRPISPNHHALADRFGLYDRFFVNAEVSPDGHNWSMGAYAGDYLQKTVPSSYSGRGRSYDYEGTNRGAEPDEDVAAPANGYLWDLADRAGISFRNFGEFVRPDYVDADDPMPVGYRGLKPFLKANTEAAFPGYDLSIPDMYRADVWLESLRGYEAAGEMPQLQIVRLPNDHTRGASPGALTPRAYMADNDYALGRVIEGLSNSPFWATTVVFVVEDDAQNGPDHVDSHRAPFLVVSPYNRPGVISRFANTTDMLATIEAILGLDALSQYDYFGEPLREVFADTPDLTPYVALVPEVSLQERNPERGMAAMLSAQLDFSFEDVAEEDLFNRVLWMAIKGENVPYPGARRASMLERSYRLF